MADISSLTHYPLKVIFAIHFVLVTWAIQGTWCPKSAMFYNLVFFLCLMWAIQCIETDEPIQFALFINVLSIFFDIVVLSMVRLPFSTPDWFGERFSGIMFIMNMLVRILTSIYLLRIGQARGGTMVTMFAPSPAMGFGRQEYEDMSQPVPQNSDFAGV